MPDLQSLPNELLSEIINYIQPSDIESFAESCTTVAAVAENKLQLHLQRKKLYSHLDLYGCHRHEETHSALAFLVSLCQDDDLAYYPVSINVDCCEAGSKERYDDSNSFEPFDLTDQHWNSLLQRLAQTAYVDDDLAPVVVEALSKADQGGIFGILLILLPNLELVSLNERNCRIDSTILGKVFEKILNFEDKVRMGTQLATSSALKRLDEVNLIGKRCLYLEEADDDIEAPYLDNDLLGFFSRIPSVRSINSLNSTYALGQFYETTQKLSNLKSLTLEASYIHSSKIDHLLRGCKALKKFSYSSDGIHFDYRRTDNIIVSLTNHTKTSLKSISITSCESAQRGEITAHTNLARCSFRVFECLKDLKVPCNLFTKPDMPAHENGHLGLRMGCLAEYRKRKPDGVQRLTHLLPPSLVRLEMEGPVDTCTVALFLEGLVENKFQKHPHSRWITFRYTDCKDDNATRLIAMRLRNSCADVGIVLDLC